MHSGELLNSFARRVVDRLTAERPEFAARLAVVDDGNFETSIQAPEGSHAGALVIRTARDADIWVHFAPAQMWYLVDDETELLDIVGQILADKLVFPSVADPSGVWVETTLVRGSEDLELRPGYTVRLLCWSGRHDKTTPP
jgi:hypothetical protein